jgi:hypothetical protein
LFAAALLLAACIATFATLGAAPGLDSPPPAAVEKPRQQAGEPADGWQQAGHQPGPEVPRCAPHMVSTLWFHLLAAQARPPRCRAALLAAQSAAAVSAAEHTPPSLGAAYPAYVASAAVARLFAYSPKLLPRAAARGMRAAGDLARLRRVMHRLQHHRRPGCVG